MSEHIAGSRVETYQHDSLVVGGLVDYGNGQLAAGQNLSRGAIMGRVTATGELVLSEKGATDGSETPVAALAHSVDASGGATPCQLVRGGWLSTHAINFHNSWDLAGLKAAFDGTPLSLVTPE